MDVIKNNIRYTKLSKDFNTNVIQKVLKKNDVFKNMNYIINLDKDAKYIGKYNLTENQ